MEGLRLHSDNAGGHLERSRSDWEALADRVNASPFMRPGWIAVWTSVFGNGRLEIHTAYRGGDLQAALPIVVHGGTASSPSNWHTPVFGLVRADAPSAAAVIAELFARPSHRVSLGFLDCTDPDLDALRAAAEAARYHVVVSPLQRSPWVLLEGEWSTYERSLGGNLRRDVRRCLRRLRELGRVTVDVTDGSAGLDARLAEAFAVERSGWKGARRTAINSRRQTADFYSEVAHWAAARGWLRLIFLRLDGRPIAVHLAIEQGGAYFPLKGGFDPAFGIYSPGKLMIAATLERAFAIGLERYEFLGGDDDYKRRWATGTRTLLRFEAFAATPLGLVNRAAFGYGRPLARRVLADVRRRPRTNLRWPRAG